MSDVYIGFDPGVHFGWVAMDDNGTLVGGGVVDFPLDGDVENRCHRVFQWTRGILRSFQKASRLIVAVETEDTAAPYRRRKQRGEKIGVMRALAVHNRLGGACLAAVGEESHWRKVYNKNPTVLSYELNPSRVPKVKRELAARAAGFTAQNVVASKKEHVFDAWYIADTLRQSHQLHERIAADESDRA